MKLRPRPVTDRKSESRGKLYVAEPGRVRPVAPLAERIESWPEAEQLRLLYGLVELFDYIGDQAAVIQTLQRIASRRPGDAVVWVRLHDRATQMADKTAAAQARTALVRLEGEAGNNVHLCNAANATESDAPKSIDRLVTAFGTNPTRADACLTLGRLFRLVGKEDESARLIERAFTLEPTRFEAAKAWLMYLCRTNADERARQLVTRLVADPLWAGDPFRHIIASVASSVPTDTGTKLANWTRPYVDRDPGGLGWLAELASTCKLFDPVPLLEDATRSRNANADDWLRLALYRKPNDLDGAKAKLAPPAYVAAAAVLMESKAGKDFEPLLENASEKRLFAQARLALHLSRGKPENAAKDLEKYLAERDLPKADAAWCRRNLAMLYAVGGTPADRKRTIELIRDVADAGTSVEELRATASVLTTLARYLEGGDRVAILTCAAVALDSAYKGGKSPKDLYNLSQLYCAAGNRVESRRCLQLLLNAEPENIYYLVAALEESVDNQEIAQARTFAEKLMRHHTGEFRAMAAVCVTSVVPEALKRHSRSRSDTLRILIPPPEIT